MIGKLLIFAIGIILLVRYFPQFYYDLFHQGNLVVIKGYSKTKAWHLIALYTVVILELVYSKFNIYDVELNGLIGLTVIICGAIIGFLGFRTLVQHQSYHEELVYMKNSRLATANIFAVVRNPMRVGLILELFGMVLILKDLLSISILSLVLIIQVLRTNDEEIMLRAVYGNSAEQYFRVVPRFNVLVGLVSYAFRKRTTTSNV